MATRKWKSTPFAGVRYREHPTRKHGVQLDRYFSIYYRLNGKVREEAAGWASQGMTAQKASILLGKLREAHITGNGPRTLAESRAEVEAERLAQEQAQELQKRRGLTFSEFWRDTYFPQALQDKTLRTTKREQSFFNKWLSPALSDLPLRDVSPIHLERIKSQMAKASLAPRTIAYCLDVVRQVFHRAIDLGIYQGVPPTTKVKRPRADNSRSRFLNQKEAIALLDALKARSPAVHAMATLSLFCGLRAGEVFNLRWSDVDFGLGTLTLRDTKNKKTRIAYMTKTVKDVLKTRAVEADHELVFPAKTGGHRKVISNTFPKTVRDLGLNDGVSDPRERVVFHTLRHTFASWLVMAGKPLYTVGKLLGHSTSSMTERYSHLAPDHMREAVQALEEAMNQGQVKEKSITTMEDSVS